MIYRFDDVCINSDMVLLNQLTDYILNEYPGAQVIWAVSPLVESGERDTQRVFPKEWNAYSDHRIHFYLDAAGLPELRKDVEIATHGLIHVDHRLLTKGQQEMSILISASLTRSKLFVPPFNKWNEDTVDICYKNEIELIRYEAGWKSMEHNKRNSYTEKWYLHAREWTLDSFKKWFENK